MSRVYVVMRRDELGDEVRAYGAPELEQEYTFPDFDENDTAMWYAFLVWEQETNRKLQAVWESIYGSESRCFLERKYSSIPFSGLGMGYGDMDWDCFY